MKTLICMIVLGIIVMILHPSVNAQTSPVMEYDNKVIIPGDYGDDTICLNGWVPPQTGNLIGSSVPGACKGTEISAMALAAISAKTSADKLEQIRLLLEQLNSNLIKALPENKKSSAEKDRLTNDALRELIVERFDALPPEALANRQFKEALNKLEQDLLEAVKKRTGVSQ